MMAATRASSREGVAQPDVRLDVDGVALLQRDMLGHERTRDGD